MAGRVPVIGWPLLHGRGGATAIASARHADRYRYTGDLVKMESLHHAGQPPTARPRAVGGGHGEKPNPVRPASLL